MQKPKTHFEQIPVETVKKIAEVLPKDTAIENDTARGSKQGVVAPGKEAWRALAQQVQQEQDPDRVIGLVEKLLATFDGEQVTRGLSASGKAGNGSASS